MKLFIGNPGAHVLAFAYAVPGRGGVITVTVPPRHQAPVGDFTATEIVALLAPHVAHYGARRVDEAPSDHRGVIWSVGEPINPARLPVYP